MSRLPRVAKIGDEAKYAIKRKSAYTLPDNPTREGMKPSDIKKAFWGPVSDTTDSLVAEMDRIVEEVNGAIEGAENDLTDAEGILKRAEAAEESVTAFASEAEASREAAAASEAKAAVSAASAAFDRESAALSALRSEQSRVLAGSAAARAGYYGELARRAMENTEGARAYFVDTYEELLGFLKGNVSELYRMRDGVRVSYKPKDLETGDTIYVKELEVPDFWWVRTDSEEGAFVYEGETLAHPLTERSTIRQRMSEIDEVIGQQNAVFEAGQTVVNVDGDALVPDYTWYLHGAGTEAEPYLIGSPAALLGLSHLSNGTYEPSALGESVASVKYFDGCYFLQTANLDLGGMTMMPIAYAEQNERNGGNYSRLCYDGMGHGISHFIQSGLAVGGLFGYIGGYTIDSEQPEMRCGIRNLTVSHASISSSGYAGTVVAVIGEGVELVNCHADADCSVMGTGGSAGGGIVGYINDAQRDVEETNPTVVSYCTSRAGVSGRWQYAGGIVGSVYGCADFLCEYCANDGELAPEYKDHTYVGGIIGMQSPGSGAMNATVSHCCNRGRLSVTSARDGVLGGIYGWIYGQTSVSCTVTDCFDSSVRSIAAVENSYNYGLVGYASDSGVTKRYRSCYGANGEGTELPYDEVAYGAAWESTEMENCGVPEDVDTEFVDTDESIICQLHPIENEMSESITRAESAADRADEAATMATSAAAESATSAESAEAFAKRAEEAQAGAESAADRAETAAGEAEEAIHQVQAALEEAKSHTEEAKATAEELKNMLANVVYAEEVSF